MKATLRTVENRVLDFSDGYKDIVTANGVIHARVKHEIHPRDYGLLIYALEDLSDGETRVVSRIYIPWHRVMEFTEYGVS